MVNNKQIHTSGNHKTTQCALPQDAPLDPAVEHIRKKLMRLMIVSIAITLILILAVLFGVIYKIMTTGLASTQGNTFSSHGKNSEIIQHTLSLPEGTQILSQSLSEHNIALKVLTSEGQTKFMIYNYYTGALIAVLSIATTKEIPVTPPHSEGFISSK
ncbi:hypothetical protein V4P56_04790 [Bartonella sp. B35(2025)]